MVYLGKVAELEYITEQDGLIEIGAMTTLEAAFTKMVELYPPLADLHKRFASLPIRNAGTLVGNLANGSPIGDAAPALIVLDASVVLRNGDAQREIPLHTLYLDYMKKDMAATEFIEAVRIPRLNQRILLRVYKLTKRFEQGHIGGVGCILCAAAREQSARDSHLLWRHGSHLKKSRVLRRCATGQELG